MKIFIFSAFLSVFLTSAFAQMPATTPSVNLEKEVHSEKEDSGEIIFIRETGDSVTPPTLKIFVNDRLTYSLPNRRFAKVKVPEGTHQYAVQLLGKQLKPKTDIIDVDVVAGETKYILLVVTGNNAFTSYLEKLELTERDALRLLSRSKEHRNY